MRPTTVRARLTLWYTLVLAVPLAVFAIGSYAVFARSLFQRTDAFMEDGLSVFAREVAAERRQIATPLDAVRRTLVEVRFQDLDVIVIEEAPGRPARAIGSSAPRPGQSGDALRAEIEEVLASLPERDAAGVGVATLRGAVAAVRVRAQPLTLDSLRLAAVGVSSLAELEATLRRIRGVFLIAIPLLIAMAAAGGWFLAGLSLAPVEESFAQQRRFMADASHELRTPVAVLRTEADVTLAKPERSEGEYRAAMQVVLDAARRLTRIVDDVFLLARADAGHLTMQVVPLNLEDVAHDAVRAVQQIATARGVRVELAPVEEAPFRGDPDLLGRVLLNLLDNAIKHAASVARVSVARTASGYAVSVVDDGPGIPADQTERIFERFYRLDSARSRAESTTTSGAGLGLAISRRLAELHGGRLELASSRPGHTEFRLQLPRG